MEKHYVSPVYGVKRVPREKIQANSYNPNKVAPPEMQLLIKSILEDGYTQPIVCYYLADTDRYEIVDGFHRYMAMEMSPEIEAREGGCIPVTTIDKPLSERIASTIRHNRARGSHSVDLMVDIVTQLTEAGLSDSWIMKNIGMDSDELLRLKQLSGLAALFSDRDFSTSWKHIKSKDDETEEESMEFEDEAEGTKETGKDTFFFEPKAKASEKD